MQWARIRSVLFKIFYSTAFTACFLLLVVLICLTPGDVVYQSYKDGRFFDSIIVAAVYVLTGLLAVLLYASRLFTNRSALRDIPKPYMPVEKEDLPGKRVKAVIQESQARSAVIAYLAKPRSYRIEDESASISGRIAALTKSDIDMPRGKEPTWGTVAHPGWSPPDSEDLPSLCFETVVQELPDLIEAKAVSLAPIDPMATPGADGMPMPDERVIEVLQRPAGMGMRQYYGQLQMLGVIEENTLGTSFLTLYERARFAPVPMTEPEFRSLMSMFAEILRGMAPVDADLLPDQDDENVEIHEQSPGQSIFSDSGSVRHRHSNGAPHRMSEDSGPSMFDDEYYEDGRSMRTDPDRNSPSRPTQNRFVSARSGLSLPLPTVTRSLSRPTQSSRFVSARSGQSLPRLRQRRSNASASSKSSSRSGYSIIRLAGVDDPPNLPYMFQIPRVDTR